MEKLQNQEIRNLFPLRNNITTQCNNVVMVLYENMGAHVQVAGSSIKSNPIVSLSSSVVFVFMKNAYMEGVLEIYALLPFNI
jgi:hypothetical protein